MERVAGITSMFVDGKTTAVTGEITYNMGYPKRDAVMDSRGVVVGFSEEAVAPSASVSMINTKSLDLSEMSQKTSATLQFALANGKNLLFSDAFTTIGDGDAKAGTVKMDIGASSAKEY